MPRNIINTGTEPGNLGDGETLRDAFSKTNANFEELYKQYPVTDTTIDHDDPDINGSIAKSLLDAGSANGGVVLLGPGTFMCPSTTLKIPGNVILKGSGRGATIIKVTGQQDGITLQNQFSGVESLQLSMPVMLNVGDGIKISNNYTHLRDLLFTGGFLSWGINADRVNVCKIDNIAMGTVGIYRFSGNGIIFQNTDPVNYPFNYGDSILIKVDITLSRSNTTAIKFHGPNNTKNVINNILLSQVEVIGENSTLDCKGIHLINANRITCNHVDLENLDVAVLEESVGTGNNVSANNSFISTFVLGTNTSYQSSGIVNRRLFLGCDNLNPDGLNETDSMLPRALWLSDNNCKIEGPVDGQLTISDGLAGNGLRFDVRSENPVIKADSSNNTASVTIGDLNSLGVKCLPGIVLPANNTIPANAIDGTVMQYYAGVVGPDRGLYQLRDGNWIFIG